jgi:hypothetical protein
MGDEGLILETVSLQALRPHPRNYRVHLPDQITHLMESIREHGLYRNIVVARDNVILVGHGVTEALRRLGYETVSVVRVNYAADDPRALKILVADNEIGHFAEVDDRTLTELLRELKDTAPEGLLGTGYDEQMLANLVFVTRPESEIADFDEAAEWAGAGMPEYDEGKNEIKLVVQFRSMEDRAAFAERLGMALTEKTRGIWWPAREKDTPSALRFEG